MHAHASLFPKKCRWFVKKIAAPQANNHGKSVSRKVAKNATFFMRINSLPFFAAFAILHENYLTFMVYLHVPGNYKKTQHGWR